MIRSLQRILPSRLGPFLLHAVAFICNRGLPFVAAFVSARLLGVADFGQFVGAISLFMSLVIFVDLGLGLAATTLVARQAASDADRVPATFLVTVLAALALGAVVSVGILLGVPAIVRWVFAGADMQAYVIAGALFVPASALASVLTGALQGLRRYRALMVSGGVGGVLYLVFVVVGALAAGGLGAIWGAALGMGARAGLSAFMARHVIADALRLGGIRTALAEWKPLFAVALPASVAAFSWAPVNTFLVAHLFHGGNGAIEAGAFGLTQQVFSLVMIIPGMLTQYALPRLSGLAHGEEGGSIKRLAARYAGISLLSCAVIALPVALAPDFVMSLLGAGYRDYGIVLVITLAAATLSAPQGVLSNYLLARGLGWHRVWSRYAWSVVVVGAALFMGEPSALNAATAYLIGWGVLIAIQVLIVVFDRPAVER